MRRFEDIVQYSFGMLQPQRGFEAEKRTCFTDTSYLPAHPINDDFEAWQNWVNSGWTATGSATLTYVSGQMQIISPDGNNHAVGAKKSFEGGTGQHTVFFELQANTCGSIIFTPPYFNPRSITVYIRDAGNSIVASQTYTATSGNFSFNYTPSGAGTHSIEFYMANPNNSLCGFIIEEVVIAYDSMSVDTICEDKSAGYRYGFNGQLKDNEIYGDNDYYEFKFRGFDPRLIRFTQPDPLASKYPWNSTYAFAENSPISGIDLEGLEFENYMSKFKKPGELAVKLPNEKVAQQQSYSVTVANAKVPFAEMKSDFKSAPQNLLSNSKATFHSPVDDKGNSTQFQKGSYIKIDIGYNVMGIDVDFNDGYVKVQSIKETPNSISATFVTMEGHIEKGIINFQLSQNKKGETTFSINSTSQVDQGISSLPLIQDIARGEQKNSWKEVLNNFVKQSGGQEVKGSKKVSIKDPK